MALNVGDAACTAGMAKRIYDAIVGGSNTGFSASPSVAQLNSIRALAYGIAVGVCAEIAANAEVSVTADADAFGTGIPPAPVDLTGAVS